VQGAKSFALGATVLFVAGLADEPAGDANRKNAASSATAGRDEG
jgi:hypothetical protein